VIQQIAARCEMLSRGITAMLQLANLRSRAQSPPPAVSIDLAALVRSSLAAVAPVAARRGIAFDEDLSAAPVRVVQDHAVMIIENVISNAVAYSRDGQRVSVSSRATPDGGAEVAVRDSGIGSCRTSCHAFSTTTTARPRRPVTTIPLRLGLAIVRQTALAAASACTWRALPIAHALFTELSAGPRGAPQ